MALLPSGSGALFFEPNNQGITVQSYTVILRTAYTKQTPFPQEQRFTVLAEDRCDALSKAKLQAGSGFTCSYVECNDCTI